MRQFAFAAIASLVATATACEGDHSCYGPLKDDVVLTRNVRRMQPDAQNATVGMGSDQFPAYHRHAWLA
jgi:hypothetical protein